MTKGRNIRKQLGNLLIPLPYLIIFCLVLSWWWVTLFSDWESSAEDLTETPSSLDLSQLPSSSYFSIDKSLIQEALMGNTTLMGKLITQWDIDAQLLQHQGFFHIERLSRTKFLRAQEILKRLEYAPAQLETRRLYLPQTHLAASFLLSLLPPNEIAALPPGIRTQTHFFPENLTAQIPLDISRYNGEAIYDSKPSLAFVASYSHPSTVRTLKNQGIPVYSLETGRTFDGILQAVRQVGIATHHHNEGELLALFMESALLAIDNEAFATLDLEDPRKVMFLSYSTHFSLPTEQLITRDLLHRLQRKYEKISLFTPEWEEKKHQWMIPIERESIVKFDPDTMIIACGSGLSNIPPALQKDPALQSTGADIVIVDAAPHEPSQYAVLAYYDLVKALVDTGR